MIQATIKIKLCWLRWSKNKDQCYNKLKKKNKNTKIIKNNGQENIVIKTEYFTQVDRKGGKRFIQFLSLWFK